MGMSTRSRVVAPLAAVLMIGFSVAAPAQAAVASGSNGQSAEAPNTGGSATAEEHRADAAQQSARSDRSDAGAESRQAEGRQQGAESSADARANDAGTRDGAASDNSGVQIDRPNDYQAQADPDGDDNGGVDQPGGDGGVDPTDQDGNNGSGNDSDCEDDNRGVGIPGHCKERESEDQDADTTGTGAEDVTVEDAEVQQTEETVAVEGDTTGCPSGEFMHSERGECVTEEVKGVQATASSVTADVIQDIRANASGPGAQVLGVAATAVPAALPQTGAAEYLTLLTITGLGLATAGVLTLLFRRRLESGR